MVFVKGGVLPKESDNEDVLGVTVGDFQIGKYEVTWAEWKAVRSWAATKGYDLAGRGEGSGDNHPVRNVNFYDVVKWCNARSEMEGRSPVYEAEGTVFRTGEFYSLATWSTRAREFMMKSGMNGYRLPRETEWVWAARGGLSSKGYTYSGGNQLGSVGWFLGNSKGATVVIPINKYGSGEVVTISERGTWPVGMKTANEIGLYDMSGNVSEMCWEQIRGASFADDSDAAKLLAYRSDLRGFESERYPDTGFRVVLSSTP
jgi:formylglycine-generating enzyme required for sulfatase activity